MVIHKLVDSTNLRAGKSSTPLQSDRVKPELCQFVLTLYMDMRRFIPIPCIEEETVWPDSQNCWHYSTFILPVPALSRSARRAKLAYLSALALIAPPNVALTIEYTGQYNPGLWQYSTDAGPVLSEAVLP